ncbi:MAG: MFS transporter [Spirochaetaceae bacterium]
MSRDMFKLKSNIKKFYIYKVFTGMFFFVPIMVLFWQDNGLSLTQIMLLQSIFSICTVILEIPSGYFADVFGRKKTLFIASVTGFLAMLSYSLGHNFNQFIIAEVFFALSVSFTSGTLSAFVYDTLKNIGGENDYKKVWGNILFYGMIALAISNVLGGLIAKIDYRYTFYIALPFFALMIPFVFTFEEPERHKMIMEKGYTKELFKIIKMTIFHDKKLRWIIIYSGIVYAFNQSALWLYQPYFQLSGLDLGFFGVVFACFQVVSAFSAKYAHKLEVKLGQKYSLMMLIFLVAISFLLMSSFVFLFSFSFCFIQQFVRGFKSTVVTDYINRLTTSSMRATVLSAESFASRLFYATIIPLFGLAADLFSLRLALLLIGLTSLAAGSVILLILKRDEVI